MIDRMHLFKNTITKTKELKLLYRFNMVFIVTHVCNNTLYNIHKGLKHYNNYQTMASKKL